MSPAVFGHGHLRLYLLFVLDERPMHGYEIIQALSDRFGGTYVPSAGTIYPRLAKLETEGLVTKESDGRKSVYAITDAGRAELNDRRDELEGIENGIGDSVRRLADEVRASVSEAMTSLRAELAAGREAGAASSATASSAARDAAREAHEAVQDATTSLHSTLHESRSDARAQVQRAEVLLAEFRQDVRTELRSAAARGAELESAVDELESRLSRLRADVLGLVR
ncbi:MAG: PadR family transcriptional regulator [Actinobacteria bacterium]|nr:PadR family transcriptional regulator [Actinomycetota bacterium]MBU1608165.1 PadR family transcriptional regulator [Actinomycetota bacterium]MBU2314887.1 PadR family transcriptional regulator [Actinomycetota bacterium]MBU2384838.1 PadR family transcriptional regulator [Actinomycetota bacterium]